MILTSLDPQCVAAGASMTNVGYQVRWTGGGVLARRWD